MGKLTIIPTPIGNLEDITLRGLRLLKEADVILAEDTRKTSHLLQHYDIQTKLQSHHQHNEHKTVESIAERIEAGQNVVLVSDAGTPGISDPGFLLVRACLQKGVEVECLPGATALIPALVASGLPCDAFVFEGFLPQKKGRQTQLKLLAEETRTCILYESPHRLLKLLEELKEYMGENRPIVVCRELTKMHEEIKRGSVAEVLTHFSNKTIKGELVIVIGGKPKEKRSKYERDEETE